MKTYYCLSSDSRRIVVQAKTKKAAGEQTGISSDLLVVCHDPKMIEVATESAMIETKTGWEPFKKLSP